MWIRDWDKMEFDFEEEAFGNACMEMLADGATGDYLKPWVSYVVLLDWAMKQDGFLIILLMVLVKPSKIILMISILKWKMMKIPTKYYRMVNKLSLTARVKDC